MSDKKEYNGGYSLIELSLTLIVISAVISTIAYSVSLTRMSDAKSVVKEIEYYSSAVEVFRSKYKALPGDITNAKEHFKGVASQGGNGNGEWDTKKERNILWPQLYQAGLISYNLTGKGDISTPGVNRPVSFLKYAGWTFMDYFSVKPPKAIESIVAKNVLRIGGANNDEYLAKGVLPISAHVFIDSKIDTAGTPLSGKYMVGETKCVEETFLGSNIFKYYSDSDRRCTGNIVGVGIQ